MQKIQFFSPVWGFVVMARTGLAGDKMGSILVAIYKVKIFPYGLAVFSNPTPNPSRESKRIVTSPDRFPQLGETRSGKILRSPIWFIVDRVEIDQDKVSPASLEAGAKDY